MDDRLKNKRSARFLFSLVMSLALIAALALLTACAETSTSKAYPPSKQRDETVTQEQESGENETIPNSGFALEGFTADTTIEQVENDPVFDGFGHLLFPVDAGYMHGDTLNDIQLTWYSHIDPNETVAELNCLRDEAASGKQVFFPIYTEEEMSANPAKRDTGLFFFRGVPGARTAICNAGGGFAYVAAMHDSFPHAFELAKMGYNAFALIYRPGAQTACEDLARAVAFLFDHSGELDINMDGYSLWGGSAGARMAAWVGTYGTQAFGEAACPKPAAVIMEYTGLGEVTGAEPPTFSVVGTSDGIASWQVMERRTEQIKANGTPAEIEVFEGLPHGFSLGTNTVAEGWINDAVRFWQEAISQRGKNE